MAKSFESWQFWNATRKLLGEPFLLRVLGKRNARIIRMYSSDPRFVAERCNDPLQHLHTLFTELDLAGRGDIARRALEYLQSAIDDGQHPAAVVPLKPTLDAEILADYQAVAELQAAIADGVPVDEVKDLVEEAKAEIDRSLTKYLEEQRR